MAFEGPQVERRTQGTIKAKFEVGTILIHKKSKLKYSVMEVDMRRSEYELYGVLRNNELEWEKAPTPMDGTDSIRESFQVVHGEYSRVQE
ncbi:MAG: hypothetical protein QY312_03840 [Candidatus Dojkabacteria bacterium]|nr:MAG: hypothetical protein QY312_03840 [Candidatus Dojkabacteria bacterium]